MLDISVASFPFSKGRVARGVEVPSGKGAAPHLVASSCRRLFHIPAAVLLDPYENDNKAQAKDSFFEM
jgi:hypothetical protein